mgnify:CR=1 FL=1
MKHLIEGYGAGHYPIVQVSDLKKACALSDDEYRDIFRYFFDLKIFQPIGPDRLQIHQKVQKYTARLPYCTFNDVHSFFQSINARERTARMMVMFAAMKPEQPAITLKAILEFGDKRSEGRLVEAVAVPWFKIIKLIQQDPKAVYQIDPWKWEEIIAGAYKEAGFDEVILTPRSGDGGKDVIATKFGTGSIRIFDQVKAYKPGNLVTADEVRAMLGVITAANNVSKGIITTTSYFAPRVRDDDSIKPFVPYRLELKQHDDLLEWLKSLSGDES